MMARRNRPDHASADRIADWDRYADEDMRVMYYVLLMKGVRFQCC